MSISLGDGLMALFGAPTRTPEDASNALNAAVAMQRRIIGINQEASKSGSWRKSASASDYTLVKSPSVTLALSGVPNTRPSATRLIPHHVLSQTPEAAKS